MKVLITGSTGLVGTALVRALTREGHSICRLLRPDSSRVATVAGAADVEWNPGTSDLENAPFGKQESLVEGADAVVNLAGASIAGARWTEKRKALLRSSRVHTTRELVSALGKLASEEKLGGSPPVLVSASAIGYYGSRGDELLTEESSPGADFLASIAQEWECEAVKAEAFGMRVVRARFGVVLAKQGGALPQMMRPLQLGVGGRIGSGRQWVSWVTLEDVVGVIRWALGTVAVKGALNVVAPEPVQNAEFTRQLAQAMRRPAILPAPAFALRLALGEMADALLLSSQRVVPSQLKRLDYRFLQPDLRSALSHVLAA